MVGNGVSVGVGPLKVTPRNGMVTPGARARMPPSGRFGFSNRKKLAAGGFGSAASLAFSSVATVALWE